MQWEPSAKGRQSADRQVVAGPFPDFRRVDLPHRITTVRGQPRQHRFYLRIDRERGAVLHIHPVRARLCERAVLRHTDGDRKRHRHVEAAVSVSNGTSMFAAVGTSSPIMEAPPDDKPVSGVSPILHSLISSFLVWAALRALAFLASPSRRRTRWRVSSSREAPWRNSAHRRPP